MSITRRQPDRRQILLWGLLLFVVALGVRMWGVSFGLPSFFSGDEVGKRDEAYHLADNNFVHSRGQPSFLYNSLFLIYSIADLVSPNWTVVDYHYMGRLWMAILGALTVVAVWRLGSRFDNGAYQVGLWSALLLSVLPLHTASSRYIKEDAPLGLMTTMTVLASVHYLREPSRKALAIAGLITGLAFSTKYTGLVLLAPILFAFLVCAGRARPNISAALLDLAAMVAMFWIGFLIFSPIYLFHPGKLFDDLLFQGEYSMCRARRYRQRSVERLVDLLHPHGSDPWNDLAGIPSRCGRASVASEDTQWLVCQPRRSMALRCFGACARQTCAVSGPLSDATCSVTLRGRRSFAVQTRRGSQEKVRRTCCLCRLWRAVHSTSTGKISIDH